MSILQRSADCVRHCKTNAYKVVKFMVNVMLVEKRAKRKVGRVIVANVTIHINNPGIDLTIASRPKPTKVSHEAVSS